MNIFRQISYYFLVYKAYIGNRLYVVFILSALAAWTEGLGIAMLLPLIDLSGVGVESSGAVPSSIKAILYAILDYLGIDKSMVGVLLFIALLFVVKGLIVFSAHAYQSHLKSKLMCEIKALMFQKYSTMNYEYYSKRNTGHFINIINAQINGLISSFDSYKGFLASVIMNIAYISMAFVMAPYFTIMAVIAGTFLLFLFRGLNIYVQQLSYRMVEERSKLNKLLVQTIHSFKYLLATSQFDHSRKEVLLSINRLALCTRNQGIAKALSISLSEPLSIFFVLVVIAIQITVLDESLASIFVALILLNRAMGGIFNMQQNWQSTLSQIGSLEIVEEEFKKLENHQENNGSEKLILKPSGIEFKDVSFAYDVDSGDALKGISFIVPENSTVAFIGGSGAGKSTLIDMLTLLHRPRCGRIFLGGNCSSNADLNYWRTQIGYVSQETVIFDDTVANNICVWRDDFNNDPEAARRIHIAAKKANALDFIEDLPDTFNTVVGDRGVRLSGGQRQRLFLARELYKKPNLLILDEATSALDSESENYVQKSIENLKGQMTVVIIAHRLSTIRNADIIYVLENGKIIEQGSFQKLMTKKEGYYSRMAALQSM